MKNNKLYLCLLENLFVFNYISIIKMIFLSLKFEILIILIINLHLFKNLIKC